VSEKKVHLTTIENLRPHPNADRLELATVLGWQVAVGKGTYQEGSHVLYFEDGLEVPEALAEELGVLPYLHTKTNRHEERVKVVGRVRLRGEPSFGFTVPVFTRNKGTHDPFSHPNNVLTHELYHEIRDNRDGDATYLFPGVRKFEPPVKNTAGNVAPDLAQFPRYTDIQNLRNYPDILVEGELVYVTEKVHGTNVRFGFYKDEEGNMVRVAGSKNYRRYPPVDGVSQFEPSREVDPKTAASWSHDTYWFPMAHEGVTLLLDTEFEGGLETLILYGEVFGKGVQNYQYNRTGLDFQVFDALVKYKGETRWMNYDELYTLMGDYDIPTVRVDDMFAYSYETIKEVAERPSLVGNPQGREGVVVRPIVERTHPKIGRVVLKYVSDKFLFGKEAELDTTDA
jgi:RNA ligase (TIGR02306 family)